MARSATKKLLHIPTTRTDRYGKQSAKYNCTLHWNKFKKDFHSINQDELSHSKLKTLLKDHILNKYWKIFETFVICNSAYMLCPLYFLLSSSFFFLPLSIPFISILHYFSTLSTYNFLYYKFIYYTIKKLTIYNLCNKFYLTSVTPFWLKHVLKDS